jgi:hypothetical protein
VTLTSREAGQFKEQGVTEREMNRQDILFVSAHLLEQFPGFACATAHSLEKLV